MLQKLSIVLCILTVIFYGCQKDVDKHSTTSASINNANAVEPGTVDSTGRWYGTYKSIYSDPDIYPDTVSEALLIHDGEAFYTDESAGETLLTSVGYYLPADKNISGNSTTFTAMIRDNINVAQLDIIGKRNTAHAICVKEGDSSVITLSVGESAITSVVKPAIDFSAFREVSLIMKDKKAVFRIGNIAKTALIFKDADKVGTIKMLSAGFNDLPQINSPINRELECTGVHLFNSYNHQLLMKETFSIKGKSHTVFY